MSSGLVYSRSKRQSRRKSEAERKRRLRKGRKRTAAFVLIIGSIIPASVPSEYIPEASYPARLAAYPYDAAQTRNLAELAALIRAAGLAITEAEAFRKTAERYLTEAERMLPAPPSLRHPGI